MGHSKARWMRPGKAREMLQGQGRPWFGLPTPKLFPMMSEERGLAVNAALFERGVGGPAYGGGVAAGGVGAPLPAGGR